ncbi:MAG: rhomboid family intramembrane serine protease [Salibacteraceae bacterium]
MNNSIFTDIINVFKGKNYLLQIVIVNAFVFVLLNLILAVSPNDSRNDIVRFFGLSADVKTYFWRIWTLLTYMFTHVGLSHVFFNMAMLYFIGRIFTDLYGQKRLLQGYLYGGILGGLLYILSSIFIPAVSSESYLIGASAGVMSIIVAIGFLQPNYVFPVFTFRVPLKYVVLIAFITSSVLYIDQNTGGKIAHYGGAIYGYLLAYYLPKGIDINEKITTWLNSLYSIFKTKPKIKVVHKNEKHTKTKPSAKSQEQVDSILDKISKYGYDSLSKEEKDYLFKFSKK